MVSVCIELLELEVSKARAVRESSEKIAADAEVKMKVAHVSHGERCVLGSSAAFVDGYVWWLTVESLVQAETKLDEKSTDKVEGEVKLKGAATVATAPVVAATPVALSAVLAAATAEHKALRHDLM